MRIWLDDIRPMPNWFDVHCKTATEAADYIRTGKVTFISFDHDLGPAKAGTGYHVAVLIEDYAKAGAIPAIRYAIHSANPVGRVNIEAAMRNAIKFWTEDGFLSKYMGNGKLIKL